MHQKAKKYVFQKMDTIFRVFSKIEDSMTKL